jgi:hypothetical protein
MPPRNGGLLIPRKNLLENRRKFRDEDAQEIIYNSTKLLDSDFPSAF